MWDGLTADDVAQVAAAPEGPPADLGYGIGDPVWRHLFTTYVDAYAGNTDPAHLLRLLEADAGSADLVAAYGAHGPVSWPDQLAERVAAAADGTDEEAVRQEMEQYARDYLEPWYAAFVDEVSRLRG